MAYYDRGAAMRRNSQKEKYEELKKYITSKDVTGQLPDCESRGKMHIIDLNSKKCLECGRTY